MTRAEVSMLKEKIDCYLKTGSQLLNTNATKAAKYYAQANALHDFYIDCILYGEVEEEESNENS